MCKEILAFEIKHHVRQLVFYMSASIFFAVGLLLMSTNAGIAFSSMLPPAGLDENPHCSYSDSGSAAGWPWIAAAGLLDRITPPGATDSPDEKELE